MHIHQTRRTAHNHIKMHTIKCSKQCPYLEVVTKVAHLKANNWKNTISPTATRKTKPAAFKKVYCYSCCRYMCYCSVWLKYGTVANWKENALGCAKSTIEMHCAFLNASFSPMSDELYRSSSCAIGRSVYTLFIDFWEVGYLRGSALRNADLLLNTETLQGTFKCLPSRWETEM